MTRAIWNGTVVAESNNTIVVEGNQYFPPDALSRDHFTPSDTQTVCPWKGTASYLNVVVDGQVNADAAWTYPSPKDAAAEIKDHVAFWRGVTIES